MPSRPSTTWTAYEDQILIDARARSLNWPKIAAKHFPKKTHNACRKRHERLMEKKNVEDWEEAKFEALAQKYLEVRKDMWTILGNEVGEKWKVVEEKCMEKGIKNLTAAARHSKRRSSNLLPRDGIHGPLNDSGIEMEELDSNTYLERPEETENSYRRLEPQDPFSVRRASSKSSCSGPTIQSMLG